MSQEELKDEKYKILLIVNESEDANITLYIYSGLSPICKFSTISKIILPKQKYLHRDETPFSFELVAIFEDKRKKKPLLGPQKWTEEKLIRITESLELRLENLDDFSNEKRVCLREINRGKELATAVGALNLYDILGLDMEVIRKMERSAADNVIRKAYLKQIRIWHPDKNFGDSEIAMQIIMAKEILLDPARRASYHNAVDYDKGLLSRKRWKSILWPECCTEEQNKAFRHRIYMSVSSLGIAVGGVVLAACSLGTATPVLAMCAMLFGGGFTAAGMQSLKYTVSIDSIVDGCESKKCALEAGKGFVVGGITAGAGSILAVGGVLLGGQEIAGVALQDLAKDAAQVVPGHLVRTVKTAMEFSKERLDDSVENQHPKQHVKRGLANAVTNGTTDTALHGVGVAKNMIKGQTVEDGPKLSDMEKVKKHVLDGLEKVKEDGKEIIPKSVIEFVGEKLSDDCAHATTDEGTAWPNDQENGETSKGLDEPEESNSTRQKPRVTSEELEASESTNGESYEENWKPKADQPQEGMIKYISEGDWISKMIVTFSLNGEESKQEVSGDKKRVEIPAGATQIQVRFQVRRPHWGDIMKYDRFKKTWCEPSEPHIFRYKKPVDRTFTISGNLWWEAVMTVSDEHHEETKEMN